MERMIEVPDAQKCPSTLTVHVGDLLWFHATGGRVKAGGNVVKMLGPYLRAIQGEHGEILMPMGTSNIIFFRAHQLGKAIIEVVTGKPWNTPKTITLSIYVELELDSMEQERDSPRWQEDDWPESEDVDVPF
jgi:hypothetical protein